MNAERGCARSERRNGVPIPWWSAFLWATVELRSLPTKTISVDVLQQIRSNDMIRLFSSSSLPCYANERCGDLQARDPSSYWSAVFLFRGYLAPFSGGVQMSTAVTFRPVTRPPIGRLCSFFGVIWRPFLAVCK